MTPDVCTTAAFPSSEFVAYAKTLGGNRVLGGNFWNGPSAIAPKVVSAQPAAAPVLAAAVAPPRAVPVAPLPAAAVEDGAQAAASPGVLPGTSKTFDIDDAFKQVCVAPHVSVNSCIYTSTHGLPFTTEPAGSTVEEGWRSGWWQQGHNKSWPGAYCKQLHSTHHVCSTLNLLYHSHYGVQVGGAMAAAVLSDVEQEAGAAVAAKALCSLQGGRKQAKPADARKVRMPDAHLFYHLCLY